MLQCAPYPLQTWWMMQAYTSDSWLPSTELQRATRLLYLIQTEQLRPPPVARLAIPQFGIILHNMQCTVYMCMY